jgi:NAD(P)-dependent dehydrogenase (short-subunit alcohol dehydrogenase family)
MKERVLIFGGNSFLAKAFSAKFSASYDIQNVYRNEEKALLNFDFENDSVESITTRLNTTYDAVVFFQGINPSLSAKDMTSNHFIKMLNINLVIPCLLVQKMAPHLNKNALILFISSIAKKKGSYDPAYGSAKAGLTGLMNSLANAYTDLRFNILSLGLVENSPVFTEMSTEFRKKHTDRLQGKRFIQDADVADAVEELIKNKSTNRMDIEMDGK